MVKITIKNEKVSSGLIGCPTHETALYMNSIRMAAGAGHDNHHITQSAEVLAIENNCDGYIKASGHFVKRKFFKYQCKET